MTFDDLMRTVMTKRSLIDTKAILRQYANALGHRDGDIRARIQRLLIDAIAFLQQQQVEDLLAEITRLLHVAEDVYLRETAPSWEVAKIPYYRQLAKDTYTSDDIEFDELAPVSMSEHGAFVQAWVWVSQGEIADQQDDPHDHLCHDCGVPLNPNVSIRHVEKRPTMKNEEYIANSEAVDCVGQTGGSTCHGRVNFDKENQR